MFRCIGFICVKTNPNEILSVGSCQAQKLPIESGREVVGFLATRFRLADPTGIPIKYDQFLSHFIGFRRYPDRNRIIESNVLGSRSKCHFHYQLEETSYIPNGLAS